MDHHNEALFGNEMLCIYQHLWGKKEILSKIRIEKSIEIPDLIKVEDDDAMHVDGDTCMRTRTTTDAIFYNLNAIPELSEAMSDVLSLQFYEREEYRELDRVVETQREENKGFKKKPHQRVKSLLLCGQPGIGEYVQMAFEGCD